MEKNNIRTCLKSVSNNSPRIFFPFSYVDIWMDCFPSAQYSDSDMNVDINTFGRVVKDCSK